MASQVDTGKAPRRKLRFQSIEDVLREIERIEAAEKAGTLRVTGNWTPGQVLAHLSAWINYAYDGFPMKPAPWFIRAILRMMLPGMLKKGMPSGKSIPNVPGGTTGADRISTEEGATRLRAALRRLSGNEPAPHDSPGFGKLSYADRVALNLRHAELHMSFLNPD
ncbi:MAG: DUF1569 domain-containing protein [Phycisphaerales bacterium]|nr:DUF1569 domain-containing protein [Phycisphaerales bacterium]